MAARLNRESESRSHEQRPTHNMYYSNPFDVSMLDPDKAYAFVNMHVRGMPTNRVTDKTRRGFEIVPSELFPNYKPNPLERDGGLAHYYTVGDTILMSCPKSYKEAEKKHHEETSRNRIRSLRTIVNDRDAQNNRFPMLHDIY